MITRDDIRLFQAQVNNDEENGGGSMSGNEVIDGEINNLFPDVSRIDVTNGDVAMRKVFPAVISQNTDVYYGMHSIIRKNPDDDRVSVTMVNTKDPHDQRTEAQTKVESALTYSYEAQFYLYGNHIEGMRALTFMARLNTDPPPLGEAFYVYDEEHDRGQYVRITDVSTVIQTLSFANGNTYTDYKRLLFICEITAPLEHAFSGSVFNPAGNQSTVKTYHTTQANAVKYHGTKTLAADITDQDTVLQLDSIYNQLVPASLSQDAMVDQQGPRDLELLISRQPDDYDGDASNTYSSPAYDGYFSYLLSGATGHQTIFDFGGPVEPGSVTVDGIRDIEGVIQVTADRTITMDYLSGTGILETSNTNSTGQGNYRVKYNRASTATIPAQFTCSIDITSANNSLVFVQNIHPLPSQGTLRAEFRSGGKWYEIRMQTLTTMGDDSSIGVGGINYNGDGSATISLTLGSEPDIGSKIIFTWAHADGVSRELADDISHIMKLGIPVADGDSISRLKLIPNGTNMSASYEWNGVDFDIVSGGGQSLDGYVDVNENAVYIHSVEATNGERTPISIDVIYDTASDESIDISEPPNGSGVVVLNIGPSVAGGNFTISYTLTVNLNHSPSSSGDVPVLLTVDQTGRVTTLSGLAYKDPSILFSSVQLSTFSIDETAGTVSFHPTDGLAPAERTYTATTYTANPDTVKASYSANEMQWNFGG